FSLSSTLPTQIYTASLHDALPILIGVVAMRESEEVAKKNRPTVYFDYTSHQETPPRRITDVRLRAPIASELASADFETNVVSPGDRKSTRLNSSHGSISYAVF